MKKFILFFLSFAFLISFCCPQIALHRAVGQEELFRKVHGYVENGDLKKAEEEFLSAIKQDPENGDLHYQLAGFYSFLEKHKEAVEEFQKAASFYSEESYKARCWGNIGWEYYLLKDYEKGIEYSQKALQIDSTLGYVKYHLGLESLASGHFEDALKIYEKMAKEGISQIDLEEGIKDLFALLGENEKIAEAHYILATIFRLRHWDYSAFLQLKEYLLLSPQGKWKEKAKQQIDSLSTQGGLLDEKGVKATETLNGYTDAVKDSTRQAALNYWNKKEKERYKDGDEVFDLKANKFQTFKYEEYKEELKNNLLGWYAESVEVKNDYVKIGVKLIHKKYQLYPLDYYFILEKGRMALANPYMILSRGWEKKSSSHFRLFIKPGQKVLETKIAQAESLYNILCGLYKIRFKNQVEVYVTSTGKEVDQLSGLGNWSGISFMPGEIIFYGGPAINSFKHEFVHLVNYRWLGAFPGSFFSEGFAVAYGSFGNFSLEASLSRTRQLLLSQEIPPLDSLLSNRVKIPYNNLYPIAGSFIRFLIDTYGIEKLEQLLKSYKLETLGWDSVFSDIFGIPVSETEKKWHSYLKKLSLPEIEPGLSQDAKLVFSYDDPEGDDYGDGNFTYPSSPLFPPGTCDILNFKAFENKEKICFQVKLKNIPKSTYDKPDFGFYGPLITIALAKKGEYTPPCYYDDFSNSGLELSKDHSYFLIQCSGAGVEIYQDGEILAGLIRKAYSEDLVDFGNNTLQFSIPKSLIGNFQRSWKFGLASGCSAKGSKDHIGSGLFAKVSKNRSNETGGGGTDFLFSPSVYDILTPPGMEQKRVLSDYSIEKKKFAVLPLIGQ
jgi:Tfp pilus assembly protein PilF